MSRKRAAAASKKKAPLAARRPPTGQPIAYSKKQDGKIKTKKMLQPTPLDDLHQIDSKEPTFRKKTSRKTSIVQEQEVKAPEIISNMTRDQFSHRATPVESPALPSTMSRRMNHAESPTETYVGSVGRRHASDLYSPIGVTSSYGRNNSGHALRKMHHT